MPKVFRFTISCADGKQWFSRNKNSAETVWWGTTEKQSHSPSIQQEEERWEALNLENLIKHHIERFNSKGTWNVFKVQYLPGDKRGKQSKKVDVVLQTWSQIKKTDI